MAITKRTGIIAGGMTMLAAASITMFSLLSSNVIHVAPGESIQAAINSAPCGAVIELDAGAVYSANLTLPKKDCTEFITIQSSRAGELSEGQRINPATQSALLVTLESTINAEPVIQTAFGAHHYKFIGVRVKTRDASVFVYDLVRFGANQTSPDQTPHHLTLDRSWIEGNPNQDTQRGLTLNCADCGVTNSHVTNIRGKSMDTQAVCGWNGTLRAHVINNYLEATGENVMWGGADSASELMIPTNVEVRRNTISKLIEWKGQGYTIKNLLEAKSCVGCTVDGNVFENNWGNEGQAGAAIVVTVRNQDCHAPWSTIQNGVFTNNIVRNSNGVFNFLGKDNEAELSYGKCPANAPRNPDGSGSVRGNGFLVANNVFDKIIGPFLVINGFYSVTVENNTDLQTCTEGCNTATFYGEQSFNYIHRNNVHDEKPYGLAGDAGKLPSFYVPNAIMTGNVIAHPYSPWPAGNTTVASLTITSDYRTPYAGAGADIDKLLAAQAGSGATPSPTPSATETPTSTPTPSPTPTATSTPTATVTPTSTPLTVSPDNTRLPPATQIVDSQLGVWTLSGSTMLRNGADSGGRGSLIVWFGGQIYAIGVDTNWWRYTGGVAWERVAGDPAVPTTPTPTPTAVPTATPAPTSTPTPSSSPTPSPSPLRLCKPDELMTAPPSCRCLTKVTGRRCRRF